MLMQNWEHVLTSMTALNQLPTSDQGADFSRTRTFCLNGWSKHFRQTILVGPYLTPEFNALFRDHCHSLSGRVRTTTLKYHGVVERVVTKTRQVFQRLDDVTPENLDETKLSYFTEKLIPKLGKTAVGTGHTLIYIPSYFDYVQLRNWFRRMCKEVDRMTFCSLCEYTDRGEVTRNRSLFEHGRVHYCLFTERYHFYNRSHTKGIRNIVFYGVPTMPHFYSELINQVEAGGGTSTLLYTRLDALALFRAVGSSRGKQMLQAEKETHLLC